MIASCLAPARLALGLIVLVGALPASAQAPVGAYTLHVEGLKTAETGLLEIVGEPEDYFGRLTLDADPPRVFAVRLATASADSLSFTLPGDGALVLRRDGDGWRGDFRYFRLRAALHATAAGPPDPALQALVALKPIAWGTLSTPAQETFPTLSADGTRLYFTRDGTILVSERRGDGWASPDTASFSGHHDDSAPYVAPEGDALLFTSNRPNPAYEQDPDARRRKDLWIVRQRDDGGWGPPAPLPAPVNVDSLGEYHGGLARGGVIYFVSYARPGGYGRSDLYRAVPLVAGYHVENLGPALNTKASEADVYVAPDERFLLFAATDLPGSYGADDIYVSYQRDDGWTPPRNLGPRVNSFAYEYAPWIDFREGFLYFTSFRRGSADLYRVPLDDLDLE